MEKANFVTVSKQENVTVFFSCFKRQDLVSRKLTFQIFHEFYYTEQLQENFIQQLSITLTVTFWNTVLIK